MVSLIGVLKKKCLLREIGVKSLNLNTGEDYAMVDKPGVIIYRTHATVASSE